ncbi:MAG: carboxymuconolactone decarboxylase family protein [Candidatus Binatia bacterium]
MAADREAWVDIPTTDELRASMPPGAKYEYDFGFFPAMGRLIFAHERIGPAVMAFFQQVMFEPGVLSRGERELVAAVTSAAQDCQY